MMVFTFITKEPRAKRAVSDKKKEIIKVRVTKTTGN